MNRFVIAVVILLAAKAHSTGKSKKHTTKATPTPAASASATPAPEASATPAATATAAAVATPVPEGPSPHKELTFGDRVLVTKTNGVFEDGVVIGNSAAGLVLKEGGTQATLAWSNITATKKTGFGGDTLAKKGSPVKATKVDGTVVIGKVDAAAEDSLRIMPFDAKEAVSVSWKDVAKIEASDKPVKKLTPWNWLNRTLGLCF